MNCKYCKNHGSSRIGLLTHNVSMQAIFNINNIYERQAGNKAFELSNHLGNVLTVVSDRKIPVDLLGYGTYNNIVSNMSDGLVDYFIPDILSATDYYAFGNPMPNKQFNAGTYRYGFNDKEKDDEVKGSGNSYDFGARINDPRLGKWLSVDPLSQIYR